MRSFLSILALMFHLSPHALRGDEGDYRLQINDMISMTVYQEDDLTTVARVMKSGKVSFPLVDMLHGTGMDVLQSRGQKALIIYR